MKTSRLTVLSILAAAVLVLPAAAQDPPIPLDPHQYSVLTVGEASSPVVVDLFVDLACSDTRDAWPTIKKVMHTYKSKVLFHYHLFPLPYHNSAYALAKAAIIVSAVSNATSTFAFFDTSFNKQDDLSNAQTAAKTHDELVGVVQQWATEDTGISLSTIQDSWNDGHLEMRTRYQFKYTAIRGVYGTPSVLMNGMAVPSIGSGTSYKEWSELIDSLLPTGSGKRLRAAPPLSPLEDIMAPQVQQQEPRRQSLVGVMIPCVLVIGLLVMGVLRVWSKAQRERRTKPEAAAGLETAETSGWDEGSILIARVRQ